MFHAMFLVMQKDLNFTATLHKRKDGKWGPTLVLPNGTIEAHGIISSLTTGYAEMIVTRYVFFILKRLHYENKFTKTFGPTNILHIFTKL